MGGEMKETIVGGEEGGARASNVLHPIISNASMAYSMLHGVAEAAEAELSRTEQKLQLKLGVLSSWQSSIRS